jgi:hypothetical protein
MTTMIQGLEKDAELLQTWTVQYNSAVQNEQRLKLQKGEFEKAKERERSLAGATSLEQMKRLEAVSNSFLKT